MSRSSFALAVIPILAFVGLAVDYSRANSLKAKLQTVLDATALMVARNAATLTDTQIQAAAESYFLAQFQRPEAKNVKITATYSNSGGSQLLVSGSADMDTEFLSVIGFDQLNVSGTAAAAWGSARVRVALVLDTTGSMADDGKITALKTATKNLLTQLQNAVSTSGDVYVSIIPFSKNVNLDPANNAATWIDWDRLGSGTRHPKGLQAEQLGSDRPGLVVPVLHLELRLPMQRGTGQQQRDDEFDSIEWQLCRLYLPGRR